MNIQTFINSLVPNRIHGKCRITGFANRKTESRKTQDSSAGECGNKVSGTCRLVQVWSICRNYRIYSKKFYKLLERKKGTVGQKGQEGKETKGRINFLTRIFLTYLYLDLIDTHPSYAIKELVNLWKL